MTLVTTRAVLLRSFPYSETSRVLRFYTDALGCVGVMGKGVRADGARSGSALESFVEGTLTVYMKPTRELQTLCEFAPTRERRMLAGDVRRFGGAAVLAELVMKHAGEEANPGLFEVLSRSLDRLAEVSREAVVATLLGEGWRLVAALGYRPMVEHCVECGAAPGGELALFDLAAGGIRCARCTLGPTREARGGVGPRLGPGARAQLAALLEEGAEPPPLDRPRAHLRLLSDFVTHHISAGRPLPSFAVLAELLDG